MRAQDALAASSANYANFVWGPLTYFVLPHYKFANDPLRRVKSDPYYQLIDSGFLDYLGIMLLLARKSERIIAFINTDLPIGSKETSTGETLVGLEKALPALFGIQPDESLEESAYLVLKESKKKGFETVLSNL
ncbi:MAG: hypothetical protein ACR2PX_27795 [Endozoicomonas sp.]|uniref:hypothetical protein n=1 Tax=Endozoicomonas sp. TaxID=1892382 RepID=UPI003D9B2AE7